VGSRKDTVQHIRDIFYRMGFNDQEIVALIGAHALGRCHTEASGYWG
jgi:cytochrome c peroxidase